MSCGCSDQKSAESQPLTPLISVGKIVAITFPLWLTGFLIWWQTKD
jgi:hypothetical protein